jgi:hypothetical protein
MLNFPLLLYNSLGTFLPTVTALTQCPVYSLFGAIPQLPTAPFIPLTASEFSLEITTAER